MKLTGWMSICSLAVVLSACGSEVRAPLKGERIDVHVAKTSLEAHVNAKDVIFVLPHMQQVLNWPQDSFSFAHQTPNAEINPLIHPAWKKRIGGGSSSDARILNAPVVAEGLIYASNTDREIVAVNAETGKKVWEVELKVKEDDLLTSNAALAASAESLYVMFQSGDVFALNRKTGETLWHNNLSIPLRGAPTLAGTSVIVIAQNNSMHLLNQSDGTLQWTHNGLEESLALEGGASATVSPKGVVVAPYSSGELYALQMQTGKYLWHDALSFNVGGDAYSSLVDITASPVIADDILYAVNYNGQLSAFQMESGRRLWSVPVSATKTPVVAGSVIFVVDDAGQLICLNRINGLVRWVQNLNDFLNKNDREDNKGWSAPLLAGDRLFLASRSGFVLTVDPETGAKDKLVNLGDDISVAPITADGAVIFFTDDARLISYK